MTLGPVVGFEGCLQRGTVFIWETFDRARVMLREVGPQVAEYPWEPIWRGVCRVLYFEQELRARGQRGGAVMNSGLRVFVRSKAPTPFGTEEETYERSHEHVLIIAFFAITGTGSALL
jgi:hypothetical protein